MSDEPPQVPDVDELKAELARRVQVPQSSLTFLEPLPPELLRNICETFDNSGTKDGNMLERLEAYARSVARRNHLTLEPPSLPSKEHRSQSAIERRVQSFMADLDMGDDALELLQCLNPTLQAEVIEQFDIQGTRDGNVKSRFMSFVRGIWLRDLQVSREVGDFLKDFPMDLQVDVMKNFDSSGSKDGNVSARLQSFATRRWRNAKSGRAPKKRDATLENFVWQWELDSWALEVLQALPNEVQQEVLTGFDASSTRDGNIGGRFLGYVRGKWSRYLELEEDVIFRIKRLPQEGQVMCLTQFDPTSTRDGNVSGRMRGFLWKIDSQLADAAKHDKSYGYDRSYRGDYQDYRSYQSYPNYEVRRWSYDDYGASDSYYGHGGHSEAKDTGMRDAILKFVSRWNLEIAVGAYLETLKDPDVVARVLEEFDPSGTQDGNVLYRLKSFVRLLCSRRKRGEWEAEAVERHPPRRKERWQKKPEAGGGAPAGE